MRRQPPAPLVRLHEKLRVYRSIFEIRYLIKVRKLLLELLIKRGYPTRNSSIQYLATHLSMSTQF